MESLEGMLDQYPEHPFVLTHMGQLEPSACQRLIESHKNIYFHTGWTNPVAIKSSNQPWVNLFKGQHLAPEWRELFIQYPESIGRQLWQNSLLKPRTSLRMGTQSAFGTLSQEIERT